ncbi:MAG: TerB family tellurite resistance protein [Alphaproteobacteria bacterium]
MSLLSKILTAGARIFGPPPKIDLDGAPGRIEPAGVTAALIALGAKMAKSDGVVTADEIAAFKRVFQASPADDAIIGRFFDLARQTTYGYKSYASIVAKRFRAQPAALEDVMDGLFHIALADGIVTHDELEFLQTVGDIFGFSEREFQRIKVAHIGRAKDDPYLILGIDEDVTDGELKRAYRRMAAANHPDRMVARGLPKELTGLANHKMAMVNKAYTEIKRQRAAQGLPKLHEGGY